MTVMHAKWIKKYADGVALEFCDAPDQWRPVTCAAAFDYTAREFRELNMVAVGEKFLIGGELYMLASTGAAYVGLVNLTSGTLLGGRSIPLPGIGGNRIAMAELYSFINKPFARVNTKFSYSAQD